MDFEPEDAAQYVETTLEEDMNDDLNFSWHGEEDSEKDNEKYEKRRRKLKCEGEVWFWEMFELIFKENVTLQVIIPTIQDMIELSRRNENIEQKRIWSKILDKIKMMIAIVQKKSNIKTVSWMDIKKSLADEKFVLKPLTDIAIRKEVKEQFVKFYNNHAEKLPSTSTDTEFIGTSLTNVPTETVQAGTSGFRGSRIDEPSTMTITGLRSLKENRPGDILERVFQNQNRASNTIQIPQFIARQIGGEWCLIKSPGEKGLNLIKLEILPYHVIQDKPKDEWSKYASLRSVFLTRSEKDPLEALLKMLLDQVAKIIEELIKKASK